MAKNEEKTMTRYGARLPGGMTGVSRLRSLSGRFRGRGRRLRGRGRRLRAGWGRLRAGWGRLRAGWGRLRAYWDQLRRLGKLLRGTNRRLRDVVGRLRGHSGRLRGDGRRPRVLFGGPLRLGALGIRDSGGLRARRGRRSFLFLHLFTGSPGASGQTVREEHE